MGDGEAAIASSYSTEDRITQFMTCIDVEAGGDGHWITGTWNIGPNPTTSDNDIATSLKCGLVSRNCTGWHLSNWQSRYVGY